MFFNLEPGVAGGGLLSSFPLDPSVLDLLPVAVYFCDSSGAITGYNKQAISLWGHEPGINNNSVQFCAFYKAWTLDGDYMPPEKTPMAISLNSGQPMHNIEAFMERSDGSKFHACINISPLFNKKNQLTGAVSVVQDISDIKNAELALAGSEKRYRYLINSLSTAVYTTDPEGILTNYNKAAVDLWGREPVLGKDFWCDAYRLLKTDGSPMPVEQCPMAICLKEKHTVYGKEVVLVRPDGSLRNVAPHPQPVFDAEGNMIGAVNMLVDITWLRNHEEALLQKDINYSEVVDALELKVLEKTADLQAKNDQLKRSEEKYHKMVEEVEDYAIILLDKNGIIQNWNKGAEKIKGYKEDEIVGRSFENFYREEDRNNGLPQSLLNEAKVKGKALHEGWRQRKDGSVFWGSIVLTALHNNQNDLIGFSKVTRDLTEKKLAEDKMKEYTSQFEFQNKELEQFAYAASHDLKEPLRKIHFYTSYISEDEGNQLNQKSHDFLLRTLNAARRMSDLIEDLLTYSRTTVNTESLTSVDLNEVAEEIKVLHKDEIDQKKLQIKIGQLPTLQAIRFQMSQLLGNLVSNSIKYRHPNRILEVEIVATQLQGSRIHLPEADKNRKYHRISVIDNGIGFHMEHSQRIFNIFQRLSDKPGSQGSGIGLAICKRIVQNHQGFIVARGIENEGAQFDVYLPVT